MHNKQHKEPIPAGIIIDFFFSLSLKFRRIATLLCVCVHSAQTVATPFLY